MMKTTALLLLVALAFSAFAIAQPPPPAPGLPPPPPRPEMAPTGPHLGLLETAQIRLSAMSLMVLGRALSPEEQDQIALANEVADLLGIEGRNFIGPLTELARAPGIFQESIRALQRGEYQQAQQGLWHTLCLLPDAKIAHRELATAYFHLDDLDNGHSHWAVSAGYIPAEDDIFVGLVKLSATDEALSKSRLPEVIPARQEEMPSVATVARTYAGLYLVDKPELGEAAWQAMPQEYLQAAPYVDLAAATVAEICIAAVEVLMDGDGLARRQEAREALLFAAIGACDGHWVEGCLYPLMSANAKVEDENFARLIALANTIVLCVMTGTDLPDDFVQTAEKLPDLRLLQALAARK